MSFNLLFLFQVRAEVWCGHHSSSAKYPLYLTTSNGSYDVKKIQEALSEKQRRYLLFCHAFTGCDTVSAIAGHGKTTLFHMFCAGDIDEHMDIFLDVQDKKDAVIEAGIAIFQYIYHAPCTSLGAIRYDMFSRKAAAGLIKPEALPATKDAAAQHSLRAYLQIQDWMLLKSMSLDSSDYGWTLGVHGYEPVPTLDPMAPDELLRFTSCNCNGDCSVEVAKRMVSSVSQHAEIVKASHARIVSMMMKRLKKTQTLTHEALDICSIAFGLQ